MRTISTPEAFFDVDRRLAAEWRAEQTELARHGFVLIYRRAVTGWTATLEGTAGQWCPGVRAVSVNGAIHVAAGGDEQRGAERWDQLTDAVAPPRETNLP